MCALGEAPVFLPPARAQHNKKKALNRREWLQLLVRIAIMRYVLPGDVDDVSTAVQVRLLTASRASHVLTWTISIEADPLQPHTAHS